MKRRRMNIVGLGDGLRARKTVDLALRHPEHNFTAVDLHPVSQPFAINPNKHPQFGAYLKGKGLREKPSNVTAKFGVSALDYLASQRATMIDHAYGHFLLQHLSYADRQKVYVELLRTLKPGASFAIIEDVLYSTQLPLELRNAGFRVHVRRITPDELQKINTDSADFNVAHIKNLHSLVKDLSHYSPKLLAKIAREQGIHPPTMEGIIENDMNKTREKLRHKFEVKDGRTPSHDARMAHERILNDAKLVYTEKPFVVITARKR